MKNKIFVFDIEWDTDGVDIDLPLQVTLENIDTNDPDLDDVISDAISNNVGFCHFGFEYEIGEQSE